MRGIGLSHILTQWFDLFIMINSQEKLKNLDFWAASNTISWYTAARIITAYFSTELNP